MLVVTRRHTYETLSALPGTQQSPLSVTSHTPPSHPFSLCFFMSSGAYSTWPVLLTPRRHARVTASSTIGRMNTGSAMNDRVEVDESVIVKNGNFCTAFDVGSGHWPPNELTEVAGVEAPSASRSSSDSGRLEMVSSRSNASDPFIRLERYAEAEVEDEAPESDAVVVLRRMDAGALALCEDESDKVDEVVLPRWGASGGGRDAVGERGDVGTNDSGAGFSACECEPCRLWPR